MYIRPVHCWLSTVIFSWGKGFLFLMFEYGILGEEYHSKVKRKAQNLNISCVFFFKRSLRILSVKGMLLPGEKHPLSTASLWLQCFGINIHFSPFTTRGHIEHILCLCDLVYLCIHGHGSKWQVSGVPCRISEFKISPQVHHQQWPSDLYLTERLYDFHRLQSGDTAKNAALFFWTAFCSVYSLRKRSWKAN